MAYKGFRSVQLRRGETTLNLTSAPYQVVAGSWSNAGKTLEFKLLIQGTSLAEVERYLDDVDRWLMLAQEANEGRLYDQVQVRTKVCDSVPQTAVLGATWRVKTVQGGTLMPGDPSLSAAGRYTVQATLSLNVSERWRRAIPGLFLEATTTVGLTFRSDGGITSDGVALRAQRAWNTLPGITVRYRWLASAASCDFFKNPAPSLKAWWDGPSRRFKMQDAASTPAVAQSAQYTFTAGQEVDVVFRWTQSTGMAIWVNGTTDGSAGNCAISISNTVTIFEPTGSQTLLSAQLWPVALSDAQCAALAEWQRPEAELPVVINPPNSKNTQACYRFFNAPGTAPGGLRVVATTGATNQDQLRFGLRALSAATPLHFECEDGALIVGATKVADADASAGNVARVTPADTSWRERVGVSIIVQPSGLAAYAGEYRLFVMLKDNASSIGVNQVQFRIQVGAAFSTWSDPVSAAAVGVRSLVDLGKISLPPGSWPEGSMTPDTALTQPYCNITLRSRNALGSGGGTLDLDAIYLAVAEMEGAATCPNMVATVHTAMLDFLGDAPTGILTLDAYSLEFADWLDWTGHDLTLQPNTGPAGTLWGYALRDGVEQAWPNDTLLLWFRYEPRWR